ncbi:MAG: DUF1569 domain-containing protein [Phycisphaeraceae bacterium]|nr:DUF1569 domain-containing protein [Phycisphaeraceae bacterium]
MPATSTSSAPRRQPFDLPNLDAVLAEVQRLHQRGYDKAGQWDLTQICRHCAQPMHGSIDGIKLPVPWFIRLIGPRLIKPRLFRTRRIKAGIPIPQQFIPAPGTGPADEQAAITELRAAIERLKNHSGAFQPSPFLGPLTRQEVLDFHTIHGAHHLSFLVPK